MTYEEKIKRVKEIVQLLQDPEKAPSIEESVALYEEGIKLLKECKSYLESVEGKIREIDVQQTSSLSSFELDLDIPDEDEY